MALTFHGGVKIDSKRFYTDSEIKYINGCSAVCIKTDEHAVLKASVGENVFCGSLLGVSDDTPVYSSIAGVFNGIMELENDFYFVVINDGEEGEVKPFEPETKSILDLTREDIIASARQFGVIDSKSGRPLWQMITEAKNCSRLVVDCTDSFAHSAIAQRLCVEKTKSLFGGAKVILHAIGALKTVFAVESSKKSVIELFKQNITDKLLFAVASLEEKYPCDDNSIMQAIFYKTLTEGKKPTDYHVLIVGAEAVIALYDAMVSGMPQTHRYISVCGNNVKKGGNFKVPRGITYHDLFELCEVENGQLIIENSLLSGRAATGSISDKTLSLIPAEKTEKTQTECISCGKCALSCPVSLFPAEALNGEIKELEKACVSCGACEYICPAGIPLLKIIKGEKTKR